MSESNHIDINSLHNTVLRETENDSLLEIKPNLYIETYQILLET